FAAAGAREPERTGDAELAYELDARTDFTSLLHAAAAAGLLETFERREPSLQAIYLRALGEAAAR
ncbi:MAG: hypothetical protein IAI48_05870, partial [Candidatus Eremiobacteraeota bacterium]|nr:hypothetical protein [Candidatus Eremiobacteraeota bacterium]